MPAKDDYIIVLDFLPHGKPSERRAEPLVQGLGDKYFNLLEVVVKDGVTVKPKEKLYIGEDKREQVKYIRGRIKYEELTVYAKDILEETITELVSSDEKRFVDIFNKANALTTRMHSLELMQGVGKKHLWRIIEERKKKPFETFKELHERVEMLSDPKKMVIKRIITELEGSDRHRLFVSSSMI
jgi:putative nucleotide binding protein